MYVLKESKITKIRFNQSRIENRELHISTSSSNNNNND